MTKFNEMFEGMAISNRIWRRWDASAPEILETVASKIETHGANPWVFSADARHFWQFAGQAEYACLIKLN